MANIVEKKLYGGKVTVNFYPDSHRYRLAGEKSYLPSVTSITGMLEKPALLGWAAKCAVEHVRKELAGFESVDAGMLERVLIDAQTAYERRRDAAASVGSQVHDFAHRFAYAKALGGEIPKLDEGADSKIAAGCSAFIDWAVSKNVKFMSVEDIAYSMDHCFVGIFDCIAEIGGKTVLLDYKTSSGIYDEHVMQASAYMNAKNEELSAAGLKKIDCCSIVRFDKETGAFEVKDVSEEASKSAYRAFVSLCEAKKNLKNLSSITR